MNSKLPSRPKTNPNSVLRNSLPSARLIKNYFGFMYLDVMSPFLQSNARQVANNNMPGLKRNVPLFLSFLLCESNVICSTNFLVLKTDKD